MNERSILERAIHRFPKGKILVVGDIMMDRFIWGTVSRISPEAPVPVVLVEKETFLLGGAANVVNNVRSLGGKAWVSGVVGDDEMGQRILDRLTGNSIGVRGIFVEPGRQTTVKTRIIAHHQQVVRIDRETTERISPQTSRKLIRFLKEHMKDFDGIILSDYGKGLLTKNLIRFIIRKAREEKKFIMVDPKLKNFFLFKGANIVTPNKAEVAAALGVPITDVSSLKKAGSRLLKRLRCDVLVITRGEEGMAIFEPHREPLLVPTTAREVYDVTGAGDTVIATMALALATGSNLKNAARLANLAAGIVVGKMGTATARPEELLRAIRAS